MLRALTVSDMVLIERLEIEFQPGLNVLTGETGAGKSILLDCLGFVLGWRSRSNLLRTGADRGEVVAVFDVPANHPVQDVLAEAGLAADDGLILRRVNQSDGRKQAYVNDRRCSVEILRKISEVLVELHGQHDDRGLLNQRGHRALLDDFAALEPVLKTTREAWKTLSSTQNALQQLRQHIESVEKDREYLQFAVQEFCDLNPEIGEDAALDAKRRLMKAGERIRTDIEKAAASLGPQGAEGAVGDALRWLQDVADKAEGRLDRPLAALVRTAEELADSQQGISDCLRALDFDPHALESCEERLFAIRALARKHKVRPDELPAVKVDLEQKLAELDDGAAQIAQLEAAVIDANEAYAKIAAELSEKRLKAAHKLDTAMALELPPLKLDRAVFETIVADAAAGPDGRDAISFAVATNPGLPPGPINKIASGGELSRFLLALKVCLTARADGLTMIFDEIDRGVGGATADAVGRRLSSLATGAQILVVTHSPQVAAQGDHHWLVQKTVDKAQTRSDIVLLDPQARVSEIARMLAGDTVTDQARAAAEVLLRAVEKAD